MIMMEEIKAALKEQYGVDCDCLIPQRAGWSALAYKVITTQKNYFLKIYEKRMASTAFWTSHIDDYMPLVVWLNHTPLSGRIVRPVLTLTGDFKYEDEQIITMMFDYIDGETIGSRPLSNAQVMELAGIMALLHTHGEEVPFDTDRIREDFGLPFCDGLEDYLLNGQQTAPTYLKDALSPYQHLLMQRIGELRSAADELNGRNGRMALCHTDAHGWNLMSSDHLVLIDWEGLKLAPVESDLFMFFHNPFWNDFYKRYKEIRPDFVMDEKTLEFYMLRRKLEDMWADLERLLYDEMSEEQHDKALTLLISGCANIDAKLVI